jgi:patatin-like phospholipase/acyl hydrolase
MRIYYLTFNDEDGDEKDLPDYFDDEMVKIFSETDQEHIIMDDLFSKEAMVVPLYEYKFDLLLRLLDKLDYDYEYKDITDDVVMDNYISEHFELLNLVHERKLDKIKKVVSTVDMILDKISQKGIDSLTEVDKEILNS